MQIPPASRGFRPLGFASVATAVVFASTAVAPSAAASGALDGSVSFSHTVVDFGQGFFGAGARVETYTVTAERDIVLSASNLLTGVEDGQLGVSYAGVCPPLRASDGVAMLAGDTCTATIRFNPSANLVPYRGASSDTTFTVDGVVGEQVVEIRYVQSSLEIETPRPMVLRARPGDRSSWTPVTLTNRSTVPLEDFTFQIGRSGFEVDSGTCAAALAPGASCRVAFAYVPEAGTPATVLAPVITAYRGTVNGTTVARDTASTIQDFIMTGDLLTGAGLSTPAIVDAGDIAPGERRDTRVAVTNTGDVALSLTFDITGTGFALAEPFAPISLEAGESADVVLTATGRETAGPFSGTFTVTGTAPDIATTTSTTSLRARSVPVGVPEPTGPTTPPTAASTAEENLAITGADIAGTVTLAALLVLGGIVVAVHALTRRRAPRDLNPGPGKRRSMRTALAIASALVTTGTSTGAALPDAVPPSPSHDGERRPNPSKAPKPSIDGAQRQRAGLPVPAPTQQKFQELLKRLGWYLGDVDGDWGGLSWRSIHDYLSAKNVYTGRGGREPTTESYRGFQRLGALAGYQGPINGVLDTPSLEALDQYLTAQLKEVPVNPVIPAVPGGTTFGIDVATSQSGIDLGAFAAAGGGFALIKQGGGNADDAPYVAPEYRKQLAGARAAGLPVGHYWFNGQRVSVEKQAQFFVETADLRSGDIVALDIEHEPATDTRAFTPGEVARWIDVVRQTYPGIRVLLYMNQPVLNGSDWSALTEHPLWIASWGADDGRIGDGPKLRWWTEWSVWQYSSRVRVPGFPGALDADIAREDLFSTYGWQPLP